MEVEERELSVLCASMEGKQVISSAVTNIFNCPAKTKAGLVLCIVEVLACYCNQVEKSLEDPLCLLVHYISLPLLGCFARTPKHSFWCVFELAKETHLDFLQKAYRILKHKDAHDRWSSNRRGGLVCKRPAAGVLALILKRPATHLLMDNIFDLVEPTGIARPSSEGLKEVASPSGDNRA